MRNRIVVLFLLFISIQPAFAENEFQFVVPVSISNVDFYNGILRCDVFTSPQPLQTSDVYGEVVFTPSNRVFPTEITVNVSTEQPENMNSYRCHIRLTMNNGVVVSGRDSGGFEENYERVTESTLINAIVVAEGDL